MVKPEQFRITLEKPIYFPGEVIKGTMYIANSKEIKCRGVRVHLQGKGHCRFGDGDGINNHTQFYTNCKRTFYGNVNKTPVIHEAGSNAIFGPPWAPDEGVLFINLRADQQFLILQAMDYEWLKKDKILGEVLVDINQCIGRGQMELRLMKKGRHELGAIYFQMDWDHSNDSQLTDVFGQPLRCLRLQIFRVLGLRDKEWFGKNDIYVRAYALPDGAQVDLMTALPPPVIDIVLPPGELTIPFSFQLPSDLPSSMVRSKDNYIVYSIYAYIDVAWRMDPSTRTFFTVMQPNPSAYFMNPLQQYNSKLIYKQGCCPPFCCTTFNLDCLPAEGNLRIIATTDRAAYAPGEDITISLEISTTWQEALSHITAVNVQLQQHVRLWADDNEYYQTFTVGQSVGIHAMQPEVVLPVPSTSPTYRGGLGQDPNWFGSVARYGDRWSKPRPDPITWSYSVAIQIHYSLPGMAFGITDYLQLHIPITITAIGLALLPAKERPAAQPLKTISVRDFNSMNPFGFGGMQRLTTGAPSANLHSAPPMPSYGGGPPMTQPMMRGNAVSPDPMQMVGLQMNMMMQQMQQMQNMQINSNYQQYPGQMQISTFGNFNPNGMAMSVTTSYPGSYGAVGMNYPGGQPNMMQQQYQQPYGNQQFTVNPPHSAVDTNQYNNYMGIPAVPGPPPASATAGYATPAVSHPPSNESQPVQPSQNPYQPPNNGMGGYQTQPQPITTTAVPSNPTPSVPAHAPAPVAHSAPAAPSSNGYGGYNQVQQSGSTDMYGFSGNTDWKLDHEVKEALPSLRLCDISPSATDAFVIRDKEEDYTVTDDNALMFKPVFYMSPPRRS